MNSLYLRSALASALCASCAVIVSAQSSKTKPASSAPKQSQSSNQSGAQGGSMYTPSNGSQYSQNGQQSSSQQKTGSQSASQSNYTPGSGSQYQTSGQASSKPSTKQPDTRAYDACEARLAKQAEESAKNHPGSARKATNYDPCSIYPH